MPCCVRRPHSIRCAVVCMLHLPAWYPPETTGVPEDDWYCEKCASAKKTPSAKPTARRSTTDKESEQPALGDFAADDIVVDAAKVSKSASVARAAVISGMAVRDAIGTVYQKADGTEHVYQATDLKYDLKNGFIRLDKYDLKNGFIRLEHADVSARTKRRLPSAEPGAQEDEVERDAVGEAIGADESADERPPSGKRPHKRPRASTTTATPTPNEKNPITKKALADKLKFASEAELRSLVMEMHAAAPVLHSDSLARFVPARMPKQPCGDDDELLLQCFGFWLVWIYRFRAFLMHLDHR